MGRGEGDRPAPPRAAVRLFRILEALPVAVACATLFGLMAMTFADVVLRSAFNSPIAAAPELTRVAMAVVVFSVLPVVSFRGAHVAVDLIDPLFPPAARRWRDAAVSLVCAALLWWPAQRVVDLAERAREFGDLTEFLRIPTFYVGWFIAVSVWAAALALLARALLLVFAPRLLPDETPGVGG